MRKFYFFLALLPIMALNSLQVSAAEKPILDSLINYDSDGNNKSRINYYYDANGNDTMEVSFSAATDGNWEMSSVFLQSYDANNNITSKTYANVKDGNIKPSNRYEWTYTGSGKKYTYTTYSWVDSTSSWKPMNKFNYVYDSKGILSACNEMKWNPSTSDFYFAYRNEYGWNANGQITYVIKEKPSYGSYINLEKKEYTYEYGNLVSEHVYGYDDVKCEWIDSLNTIYTVDDKNMVLDMTTYNYNKEDSTWLGEDSTAYEYNILGKVIKETAYQMNLDDSTWIYYSLNDTIYNMDGTIASASSKFFFDSVWVCNNKTIYTLYDEEGNLVEFDDYDSDDDHLTDWAEKPYNKGHNYWRQKATAITNSQNDRISVKKIFRNGHILVVLTDGNVIDMQGRTVK